MTHPWVETVDVIGMLTAVCDRMIASEELLARADREVGDGDHGQGMARGFRAARDYLHRATAASTPHQILVGVGTTLIGSMGGASGVVFGTLFRGARTSAFTGPLTVAAITGHLDAAVAEIQRRGGARAGDKTMLDAVLPAVEALRGQPAEIPVAQALCAAAEAAQAGAEATKAMTARHGKSATLGPRSLGHPDPGAISVALIFREMADWLTRHHLSPSTP